MASLHSPRIALSPSNSQNPNRIPNFQSFNTKLLLIPFSPSLTRRLYFNSPHHDAHPFNSTLCRCKNTNSSEDSRGIRWDLIFQDALKGAAQRCKEYLSSYWNSLSKEVKEEVFKEELKSEEIELNVKEEKETDEWNWERWKKHFEETKESEVLLHALKLQFKAAISREDYKSAERFKQAIATATKYDAVGKALLDLNRAIEEERYTDAAFIRDNAGAGLIGWWAGVSENASDPHGVIVRITAEYGRYVAKCYNSRQLKSSSPGFPIFEIYFTEKNGEFKQQAVYINPKSSKESGEFTVLPLEKSFSYLSDSLLGGKGGPQIEDLNLDEDEEEEKDESDLDILDLDNNNLPPFSFKILKVTSSGKIDRDYIAKIIDQILDDDDSEEDEEDNIEDIEDLGSEDDENNEDLEDYNEDLEEEDNDDDNNNRDNYRKMSITFDISQNNEEYNEEGGSDREIKNSEGESVKGAVIHVPARLEMKNRFSFDLHVESEKEKEREKEKNGTQEIKKKKILNGSDLLNGSGINLSNLAKLGNKKKISIKIIAPGLKLLNRNKSQQRLSGLTNFRRIMTPVSSDPLTGLYVSASMMESEVICLQRKVGQWKEDDLEKEKKDLEFYEYVEAVKLTGGQLVPAPGQVMFRAKVGKRHQLPHQGLIPKELGVVARYKGQGRVPDPLSKKTQWVDGELLILDGKFIRDGPVIGFFYWASSFQFFEFFSRLNLPD